MGNALSKHRKRSVHAISNHEISSSTYVTPPQNTSSSTISPTTTSHSPQVPVPVPVPVPASGPLSAVGVVEGGGGGEGGHQRLRLYLSKIGIPYTLPTKDSYFKVTACILNNMHLTTFPTEIIVLRQLVNLEMSDNELTCIPKEISMLKKLKRLVVMNNKIEQIHPNIGDLQALSFVEFSHNRLRQIPESFQHLKKLSGLGLSDNLFSEFPIHLCHLTNLTQLGFHTNNISVVPKEISQLQRLKKLDISKNRLERIPESFGSLVNLEWLNLGHNSISSLPNSLGALVRLTDFGLAHNSLESISWARGMISLKSLIIYDNKFTNLDGNIIKTLVELQVLEASQNEIRSFPVELLTLPKMQKINLQRNRIRDFPLTEDFKYSSSTISTILLQYNLIELFPQQFQQIIERLEHFAIDGNPLIQNQLPLFKYNISLKEIALNELLVLEGGGIDNFIENIPITIMQLYDKRHKCECCKRICVHPMQQFVFFCTYKHPNGRSIQRIPFRFFVCNQAELTKMITTRLLLDDQQPVISER